jgi:hypothetical protein
MIEFFANKTHMTIRPSTVFSQSFFVDRSYLRE